MRILLVEDDASLAHLLKTTLVAYHYQVDIATDGRIGLELADSIDYDLILLDLELPKLNGIQFCQQRRTQGDDTPILMLTAQDSNRQKIAGLDAGADDYVVKPFDLQEVLARIRVLLRRGNTTASPILEWGKLRLDPRDCRVTYADQLLRLTSKEYELLNLFLHNTHRIFSQRALLDHLWSLDESPTENAVRAHIKSLRQKLKQAGADDLIETVYGLGYRLSQPQPESPQPAPSETTATDQGAAQLLPMMATIWARHKDSYTQRLTVIEQAITALVEGTISEVLRQQARQNAHTLAGSLGSFGLIEASTISRELEAIFESEPPFTQLQPQHLIQLIDQLRQAIEQPFDLVSSSLLATPPPELKAAPVPNHNEPSAHSLHKTKGTLGMQSSLLIVEENMELAEQLAAEAIAWKMQVKIATSPKQAMLLLQQRTQQGSSQLPDVILLDLSMSSSSESGFELLSDLSTHYPQIPVVVLTAQDGFAERVKVARLGGKGFLQKPITSAQVFESIAQVLQHSTIPEAKILIVDDDLPLLERLHGLLQPWGFQLMTLNNPQQFWDVLEEFSPNLLILDIEMPGCNGIELCQVVRNEPRWEEIPILILSAHTDVEMIQRVFAAGADDFVNKPIAGPELIGRVINRLERTQVLRKLAETDSLTGVTNRRKSVQDLTRLLRLADRQQLPFCFVVLDLDRFKQVNDQHGHDAGDRVLIRLGELLHQSFRSEDVVARWGGEEFVIGLYNTTQDQGIERLTWVLESFKQITFIDVDRHSFQVSFSAGVVEYPLHGETLQELYRAADVALYDAKAKGRAQIAKAL